MSMMQASVEQISDGQIFDGCTHDEHRGNGAAGAPLRTTSSMAPSLRAMALGAVPMEMVAVGENRDGGAPVGRKFIRKGLLVTALGFAAVIGLGVATQSGALAMLVNLDNQYCATVAVASESTGCTLTAAWYAEVATWFSIAFVAVCAITLPIAVIISAQRSMDHDIHQLRSGWLNTSPGALHQHQR